MDRGGHTPPLRPLDHSRRAGLPGPIRLSTKSSRPDFLLRGQRRVRHRTRLAPASPDAPRGRGLWGPSRPAPAFEKIPPVADFPALEARIREFWRERDVFARSVLRRRGAPRFVFYEGPPTANGLPHNGHALTRVIKDVFPRYRAMRGFDV